MYSSSFAGPLPSKAEIEPAVEAALVVMPALRDQRPERFRYLQAAQDAFIADRAAGKFEAHRVDFAGRPFDLAFDLVQREGVIGALVPIALAIDGVKIEPGAFGGRAPIVALGTDDALHGRLLAASMGVTAVAVEAARHAAEAAIVDRAAIEPPIRTRHRDEVRGRNRCRGTKPIDTAPTAAVPIMVKITRRERFMVRSPRGNS